MIVVTGASGFIGANVVRRMADNGTARIVAVDFYPALRGRVGHPVRHDDARYVGTLPGVFCLDVADLADWALAHGSNVRAMIHLGACADTTNHDLDYMMRVNCGYSQTVWELCTIHALPLIYASSAATYGDGSFGYDDEADPRQFAPLNAYAQSKHEFDLWALEQKTHPRVWCGLKFFNVYGLCEWHKGPMASMAYQLFLQAMAGGRVRLFKSHRPEYPDGHQRRDFIHVDDVVSIALWFLSRALAGQPAPSGLYNVGTGVAHTFVSLAREVLEATGQSGHIDFIDIPPMLREKYQYHTEATTRKLRSAGWHNECRPFEVAVGNYVRQLIFASPDHTKAPKVPTPE